MATELEHPEQSQLGKYLDARGEQLQAELTTADAELAAIMKRMASGRAAMEKAQGSEFYERYALAHDVVSVEYRNAWLTRQQVVLRHENNCAQEFIKEQGHALNTAMAMLEDFADRLTLAEAAVRGIAARGVTSVEVNPVIKAYHEGIRRERVRKTTKGGENAA